MRQLTLIALLFPFTFFAQGKLDFENVPKQHLESTRSLSYYLTQSATTDSARAAHIYQWITHNVAYDYGALKSGKLLSWQTAAEAMKKKKSVCQGYSTLLVELLRQAEIEAVFVEGYTRRMVADSAVYLLDSDHAWVSFRLGTKWYLCDPTWDAGYIGRMPKEMNAKRAKRKADRQEKRINRIDNEVRKTRVKNRIEKRKTKKAAGDVKYSNKIGFVRNPTLQYFMQEPDSFAMSHLSTMPQFQLMDPVISMTDFTDGSREWDEIFAKPGGGKVNFTPLNNSYADLPEHEKWVTTATRGFEFNPYSYFGLALHYHNYINVHLSESFRKMFPDIQKSDLTKELPELRILNDSVKLYAKNAQKISKASYSFTKRLINKQSKEFTSYDKPTSSSAKKLGDMVDKNVESLGKYGDDLKKQSSKLKEKQTKLLALAPTASTPVEFDKSTVPAQFQTMMDSVFRAITVIEEKRAEWEKVSGNSDLLQYRYDVFFNALKQAYFNQAYLQSVPEHSNDSVIDSDIYIAGTLDTLMAFQKEAYGQLLYPDTLETLQKDFERLIKSATTRLKNYEKANAGSKAYVTTNYLNVISYQVMESMRMDIARAQQHRRQLLAIEKQYGDQVEELKEYLEVEHEFKEENKKCSLDALEKSYKRSSKLLEAIVKAVAEREEFFEKKLGPKPKN